MKEKKVRKLAAVMFTDIVGYTAMMEGDEGDAIKVRTRHRDIFQQQHALHLEKALELEPNHQESHEGLADCYSFMGNTGFMPFEEAWGKATKYTNQAKVLNNRSSGVHYQLSNQAFFIECDYGKSLREMKKVVELNPNNAEAQQFLSFLYIIAEEREKALDHLEIAHCLNPLSDETHFFRAYYHYMTEDFPRSLELIDLCLSAHDLNIPADSYLFMMHAVNGDMDNTFEWVARAIEKKSSLLLLRYTYPVVASIRNDPRFEALKLRIYRFDATEEPVRPKTRETRTLP